MGMRVRTIVNVYRGAMDFHRCAPAQEPPRRLEASKRPSLYPSFELSNARAPATLAAVAWSVAALVRAAAADPASKASLLSMLKSFGARYQSACGVRIRRA